MRYRRATNLLTKSGRLAVACGLLLLVGLGACGEGLGFHLSVATDASSLRATMPSAGLYLMGFGGAFVVVGVVGLAMLIRRQRSMPRLPGLSTRHTAAAAGTNSNRK